MGKRSETIEDVAGDTKWVEAVAPHENEFGAARAKAKGDRYEVASAAVRQHLIGAKLVKPSTAPRDESSGG